MIIKKKKPTFHRQRSQFFKRLKKLGWRRPRGKDSKQKRKMKASGYRVEIGYGQPKTIRYLHPSGFKDVRVFNINDLKGLDNKVHAVRIGSSVGKKKRAEIAKKAGEMKLKMLNK
jgi:large subunit ribosomal protein L32e